MILRYATLLALSLSLTWSAFASETNNFILLSDAGKPIGKASYILDKAKDGSYKVRSHYEYKVAAQAPEPMGNGQNNPTRRGGGSMSTAPSVSGSADFTAEYRETGSGDFITGSMHNSNSQMMTSFAPDKTRLSVEVSQMQYGNILGTHNITMPKPDYLFAPDYDPGALQLLLTTALANPHADGTYTLLVPPSSAFGPDAESQVLYVILEPLPAASGTLDGKPIALRHYLMNYHDGHAQLYFDETLHLMEADIGPLGAQYVRVNFALTPTP